MQRKFRVDYDYENDSLFLYRAKSKGSVELGNIILDFDANKELVGIEILGASKFIQSISETRISKKLLSTISDAKIDMRHEGGFLILKLLLSFAEHEQVLAPITVPSLKESSPLAASV